MKINYDLSVNSHLIFKKLIMELKIAFFIIMVSVPNIFANPTYSQVAKVSLDMENKSLEQVMDEIERQSEFYFILNQKQIDINRVVDIKVENKLIPEILQELFNGTKVNYAVFDRKILLTTDPLENEFLSKSSFIESQQKSITGTVTEKSGIPIPGVYVRVTGTTQGTMTDSGGKYSIIIPSGSKSLTFTFIGMEPQEISIGILTQINVTMVESDFSLEEVVVTGYGTSLKKDLTGAASNIRSNDFNQGALTNPLQAIAGRAAGINIVQTGSEPGASPSIRIRGITSLIGGNDPLVVVDGIQGNLELLNQVPPSEIESVDILKDASATAIYGSRGAAGVILVTTKKNKAGKFTAEYNGTVSFDAIARELKLLNAEEWRQQATIWGVGTNADHGASTDWYNLLIKKGYTQNHTLAFGGGSENFSYRGSLTAILQNGLVLNSTNNNYTGRLQATQKAFDNRLTLNLNLSSGITNTIGSPTSIGRANYTGNLISNTYVSRPTDPVFNSDGTYFLDQDEYLYVNPYAVAQEVTNEGINNNLFGSFRADLEIIKGLTAGWFGSWRKADRSWGYYAPPKSTIQDAIVNKGIGNITSDLQDERLMDISLNYKKAFGNHNLEAIGVYEWQNQTYQGSFVQGRGFIADITTYNALQLGDITKVQPGDMSSYKNDRLLVSFLGRVNYSLLNRYLLTLSIRRDGSSVFGTSNKWGNFPSASIAWKINEEPFMSNLKFIDQLKLRVGYGTTGNQQGLGPQRSLELVGGSGYAYFNGNVVTNFGTIQNANADLKWETRYQTNVGIDFGLFDNRLYGVLDAFTSTTKNLLFNYNVPQPPYPFGSVTANVGSLLNKGIEITLNYQAIRSKDITFTIGGNISFLRNKVLDLSGSINGIPLITNYVNWGINSYLIEGQPIGTYNILRHLGKDDTNSETVVDVNEDGIIDQGSQSPDRSIMGSALPTYTYAFTPSLNYKNLTISMAWLGSGGNKIYNSIKQNFSFFEALGRSNLLNSSIEYGLFTTKYSSDLWLENGSFLRFENLTIGYQFNAERLKYVSSFGLSLIGNNLALFTKYSGLDPEINVNGASGSGADSGIYPRTRSIAVGFNIIFK